MNFAPREGLPNLTGVPLLVAPNTYNISYPCCKYRNQHYAPFLTFCERKTIKFPCYTEALYDPPVRSRIRNGNSLQYTAPRVTVDTTLEPPPNEESSRKPYISRLKQRTYKKGNSGKLYVCRVEYTTDVSAPCIPPHRNYRGYDIDEDDQLVKIPPKDHDVTIGPAFYDVPTGELNFNTTRYQGCKWSLMKGQRTKVCSNTNPGPDHYDVKSVKCLRHKDYTFRGLTRKCCNVPKYTCQALCESKNEGRPGPGDYETVDICNMGKINHYCLGYEERFTSKKESGPGPATYQVCDCYNHRKDFSLKKGIPFCGEALRFPIKRTFPMPGPSDYDRVGGKCVRYQGTRRAFNSTAERKMGVVVTRSPAPCDYNIPLQGLPCCSREPKLRSSVFSSMTCRFQRPKKQEEPDPATYSVGQAYKYSTEKRSHASVKRAAFNASEAKFSKIYDFAAVTKGIDTPSVGVYDLPPLRKTNGNTIPYAERFPIPAYEKRPDPQTYTLHKKVGDSMCKGKTSYNLRLMKQVRKRENAEKFTPLKRPTSPKKIVSSIPVGESSMFVVAQSKTRN